MAFTVPSCSKYLWLKYSQELVQGTGLWKKGVAIWVMQIKYKMWAGPGVGWGLSYSLMAVSYLYNENGCKTGQTFYGGSLRNSQVGE